MSVVTDSVRRTLQIESRALVNAANKIDEQYDRAIDLLANAGRVIVTGIGKSGAIAQKLAGTLTSTGTPATWIHPVDSLHGDLGLVSSDAVAIMLSKSGETEELFGLIAALSRRGVPIVAITGAPDSALGKAADAVLDGSVEEEACPHGLAPTTSTTVAMAIGDALAMALLEKKGFGREDFAELHPGGALGRRLLLRVESVMVPAKDLMAPDTPMRDIIMVLARERGIAMVASDNALVGVITAGDLTRLAGRTHDYLTLPAAEVMSRNPRTLSAGMLAATALGEMERNGVSAAPVINAAGKIEGVVHLHDLLRAGAG